MKTIISILITVTILCCSSCKKSSSTAVPPPVDDGVSYEVSAAAFPNPERGFIRTLIAYSEGAGLNTVLLGSLRDQNITMVLRLYYLEAFKDKAISSTELALIESDMAKIRAAGLKAILRFAYTDDMSGTDAPLSIIEQHLDQLKPVFENNQDVIAFVQAGFIGAWGEWHSSSNGLATTDNRRKVLNKLLSVLPQDIMVQVRTPLYKQEIFNSTTAVESSIAYTTDGRARVGHHNDCFLTGGTDYGTYLNITAEKQYISNEALFVPTGGETCPPSPGYNPTCNEGRNEMKLLKWTYLNLDYYQPTLNAWRSSGCFDEFQANLGYRLALVSSKIPTQATAGSTIEVKMSISNRGYAPLYHKKNMLLVFKNKSTGIYYEKAMNTDMRTCKPNGTLAISENISLAGVPAGDYDLYVQIADKDNSLKSRSEYTIRLANTGLWDTANGGMNNLKHALKIN
jgi:hypothetical protein